MKFMLHECFNGTRVRLVNEFSSRAKAVKWIREWYVKVNGHYLELVNAEDGSLVGFDMEDKRQVKPMGWGFKVNWEDKPGKPAKERTVYAPKAEFRR